MFVKNGKGGDPTKLKWILTQQSRWLVSIDLLFSNRLGKMQQQHSSYPNVIPRLENKLKL